VHPGGVYVVEYVWDGIPNTDTGVLGLCLDLVGVPRWGDEQAFGPRRFRKIRPHTPDAEDAETIRLLTGAPAKLKENSMTLTQQQLDQLAELIRQERGR
jgi:hypothetical protein